jgi:hypothetical protein
VRLPTDPVAQDPSDSVRLVTHPREVLDHLGHLSQRPRVGRISAGLRSAIERLANRREARSRQSGERAGCERGGAAVIPNPCQFDTVLRATPGLRATSVTLIPAGTGRQLVFSGTAASVHRCEGVRASEAAGNQRSMSELPVSCAGGTPADTGGPASGPDSSQLCPAHWVPSVLLRLAESLVPRSITRRPGQSESDWEGWGLSVTPVSSPDNDQVAGSIPAPPQRELSQAPGWRLPGSDALCVACSRICRARPGHQSSLEAGLGPWLGSSMGEVVRGTGRVTPMRKVHYPKIVQRADRRWVVVCDDCERDHDSGVPIGINTPVGSREMAQRLWENHARGGGMTSRRRGFAERK